MAGDVFRANLRVEFAIDSLLGNDRRSRTATIPKANSFPTTSEKRRVFGGMR
jgi:hypothetical protein